MYKYKDFIVAEKFLRLATWKDVRQQWRGNPEHVMNCVVKPILRHPILTIKVVMDCLRHPALTRSERRMKPFPHKPIYNVDYIFSVSSVPLSYGNCLTTKRYTKNKVNICTVILVWLNKHQKNEKVIMETIQHEDLHLAIHGCMESQGDVVESVIESMMRE